MTGSAATRFIEDRVPTSRRDEPDARGRRTRDSLSPPGADPLPEALGPVMGLETGADDQCSRASVLLPSSTK